MDFLQPLYIFHRRSGPALPTCFPASYSLNRGFPGNAALISVTVLVRVDRSLLNILSMVDLVHPGAVLLLALLAKEVQLALVALVQRAQAGLHHLPLKANVQLVADSL